jgi:hypothetical protein
MSWQPVPLVAGVEAICFKNGHFLVTAKKDRLYYAWNIHRCRGDGTLETLNAIRIELCDFPNVPEGLAWADGQLVDYDQ